MGNRAYKGGDYERELCKKLTFWWTGDPDSDVLWWRTSQSGGRATSRRKKNKAAAKAHCGDLYHIDEEGRFLTELLTIESKRGYSSSTIHDVLDAPLPKKNAKNQTFDHTTQEYEKWILQASNAALNAGTPYWAIIHRRDGRQEVVFVTSEFVDSLERYGGVEWGNIRRIGMPFRVADDRIHEGDLVGFRLDDFLSAVQPCHVKKLYRRFVRK